ncbi:MAG: hypothetical protein ACTTH7_02310 [Treponema sp.]
MDLRQKNLFYTIEAKVENNKLKYERRSWFSKINTDTKLMSLQTTTYEELYISWKIGIPMLICFFLAAMLAVDTLRESNTIDNVLFYFIPGVILLPIFIIKCKHWVYIYSDTDSFQFLKRADTEEFIHYLLEERKKAIKKYYTTFTKEISFEEQKNYLTHLFKSHEINEAELTEYIAALSNVFADVSNAEIGFGR